jgi:hypothetical protein
LIKGTPSKSYNGFEEELNQLIGIYQESYGLEFYFRQLHHTFLKSETAVVKYANEYLTEFNKEDHEVKESIVMHDPEHLLKSTPLVDTLRKSYFTTVHSEFESVWKDIITIYNNHFETREIISLSDKFLIHPSFSASRLLDKVVLNHKILLSYNYIRNKIVHQKAVTTSAEYQTMFTYVQAGKINHLKIDLDGINVRFAIENINFIKDYANCIIDFIREIVETSFTDRQYAS